MTGKFNTTAGRFWIWIEFLCSPHVLVLSRSSSFFPHAPDKNMSWIDKLALSIWPVCLICWPCPGCTPPPTRKLRPRRRRREGGQEQWETGQAEKPLWKFIFIAHSECWKKQNEVTLSGGVSSYTKVSEETQVAISNKSVGECMQKSKPEWPVKLVLGIGWNTQSRMTGRVEQRCCLAMFLTNKPFSPETRQETRGVCRFRWSSPGEWKISSGLI